MHRHLRNGNLSPAKRGGGIFGFTKNNSEISEEIGSLDNTIAATGPNSIYGYWTDSGRYSTDWSGSGTEADPYLITNELQLAGLSYMVYSGTGPQSSSTFYKGMYFKQTSNIDLSKYYWQPIGINYDREGTSNFRSFGGVYDGAGHTVSGVFTKLGSTNAHNCQGLFGYVSSGGIIKDLGVLDSYIRGNYYVGGVLGRAGSSSSLINCYNSGVISGVRYVGGVCGDGNVQNGYNTGEVTGNDTSYAYVGGVVGKGEAINCYNIGNVIGKSSYVGGILGQGIAKNCFNIASVGGAGAIRIGGIVGGGNSATADVATKCYYGGKCTLTAGVGYGTDSTTKITALNTTSYALNKAWYINTSNWDTNYPWDFENVWEIDSTKNNGYPTFIYIETWEDYAASSYAGGSGTQSNPYIIKTPEQLAKVAKDSASMPYDDRHYRLAANINLSAHEWKPIGIDKEYYFRGVFDGDMYTISNLKINSLNYGTAGLFCVVGYYSTGCVKNVIMDKVNITIGDSIGAIAGLADSGGVIENCIVKSSIITASGNKAGGIVGFLWNSHIRGCQIINSTITGENAGGAFGYEGGTAISNVLDNGCYGNTITGTNAGALFGGYRSEAAMRFNGSYAQGIVNGTATKLMYGDSNAWGNWSYSTALNGGYPVQKPLFTIGGISGSTNVYNYLKNTLGFTAA